MPLSLIRVSWTILLLAAWIGPSAWAADSNDPFGGKWDVTVTFGANTSSATLELTEKDGKYEGNSGALDELGVWPLAYTGTLSGKRLALTPALTAGKKPSVGALVVSLKNKQLVGNGTLYGVPVTLVGVRPSEQAHEPKTHEFVPKSYVITLSGRNAPVLHINPGDSVKTTTIDAQGQDGKREWASMPGNPHTGPFFVEGAMPGDTLVVHLTSVRMNSDRASMWCRSLDSRTLPSWREPEPKVEGKPDCERDWVIDTATQTARPLMASEKLKDFSVPLRPMIGSIGVAPPWNLALPAGDLLLHGGNLDYNRIVEGATVYLPVFRAGALLSLGDGHAVQGDGEITGQGLETALAVEFKVDLIKGKAPPFPRIEDAEFYMFSGIGNSMENALQAATGNVVDWLKDTYGLEPSDIAMLLGTSIQYDIAEVVDPRPHVVAKLRKDVLAKLHKP
jgi:acetamidase/formamidase